MKPKCESGLSSSRRSGLPCGAVREDEWKSRVVDPVLTVIVPVYNEAGTINALLTRVMAVPFVKQVVVIDDGSTDETARILEKWRESAQVELICHPINRGKGAAIRTGLARACGRFVIIQDGDLEYDPADYSQVIEPLLAGQAKAVYGSRYLTDVALAEQFRLLRFGIAVLNLAVRLIYGVRLTDEATCYKAISTELLRELDLQCERFDFCPELTAKLCRRGEKIIEVPIQYKSRNVRAGKKLRWTAGIEALRVLWRYRRWTGEESPQTIPAADHPKDSQTSRWRIPCFGQFRR